MKYPPNTIKINTNVVSIKASTSLVGWVFHHLGKKKRTKLQVSFVKPLCVHLLTVDSVQVSNLVVSCGFTLQFPLHQQCLSIHLFHSFSLHCVELVCRCKACCCCICKLHVHTCVGGFLKRVSCVLFCVDQFLALCQQYLSFKELHENNGECCVQCESYQYNQCVVSKTIKSREIHIR